MPYNVKRPKKAAFQKNFRQNATILNNPPLCGRKFEKQNSMSKILKVFDPFFTMDVDDTFVLSPDGKNYVAEHNEEFHTAKDGGDMNSSYHSTFTLSPKWAKQLVEDGYLEEVTISSEKPSFVNVFDEIDNLIEKYNQEYKSIAKTMANEPECLRVEKATVLSNILKVLNHLKSLRK